MKTMKEGKRFKIFENFEKKGLGAPRTHLNLQMKIFKKYTYDSRKIPYIFAKLVIFGNKIAFLWTRYYICVIYNCSYLKYLYENTGTRKPLRKRVMSLWSKRKVEVSPSQKKSYLGGGGVKKVHKSELTLGLFFIYITAPI